MRLLSWLMCRHSESQLSRVVTINGRTYRVCLTCGAELEYSLDTMQLTGRVIERSVVRHPDYVAIARGANKLSVAGCQSPEKERTLS